MQKILILILALSSVFPAYALTGDSLNYLTRNDTLFLHSTPFLEKFFIHTMEENQTLYSLAKFYGLSIEELYFYNDQIRAGNVHVGSAIRIPIPNRAIKRYKDESFREWEHIPVYYVVKKGDTMFRISKLLFRMEMEELMSRNNLDNTTLHIGQLIHVGWMNINGIPESYRQSVGGPLARRNNALKRIYLRAALQKDQQEEQGVAFWNRNSQDDTDFYALHSSAPINSLIAVTNPMSRRTVYTKVTGRIPVTTYGPNVKVVLSPLAAKFLAARDPRFFVKIRYCK